MELAYAIPLDRPTKKLKAKETPSAKEDDAKSQVWKNQKADDNFFVFPKEEHVKALDPDFEVSDDEDDDHVLIDSDVERKNYRLYMEDFEKSGGFDINHYFFGGLVPLRLERDSTVVRDCKKAVEAVIRYQNGMNKWDLELVQITKCYYYVGSLFYATFDAIDNSTGVGVARTFLAKIDCDHWDRTADLFLFREKAPQLIQ